LILVMQALCRPSRQEIAMFGLSFIKTQPTQYVIQFRNGRPRREGAGLSMIYFAPLSSLVMVPTASVDEPFIFEEVTGDFQDVTVQGQITYRVADPKRTAALLDFTLDAKGHYLSEDPQKLSQRVIDQVHMAMRAELQSMQLKEALISGERLASGLVDSLRQAASIEALGVEILGLSILAIKPRPETARALEAEAREELLRRADEAIYARRNAAIEQERAIKESELATEVAVETKKHQVKEAQMESDRVVRERRRQIEREEMAGKISLEDSKRQLVGLVTANAREEADAKAYGIDAMMKAFAGSDAKILQALASVGMQPSQLLALAFRDLADNAGKIGQLNMSPDLLREIMASARTKTP
jgi:regulator of protease activity HflC (stomatin/prohibitin superfamily)